MRYAQRMGGPMRAGTGMRRNYEERQMNGKTSGLTSDGVIAEVCDMYITTNS